MECGDVREKNSAYIEGIISSEEKSVIDEHLKSCRKCSESLADLRKTLEHVKNLEDVDPPQWLTQKIMTEVRAKEKSRKGILERLFYPLHVKLPIEAAATLLIAVTAFYIFKSMQPGIDLETYKLAKAPSERTEPQVPPSPTSRKGGEGGFGVETRRKEAVVGKDEDMSRKRSPKIGVSTSIKKREETALEQLGERHGREEFSFEREKNRAVADSKTAPAKPVEQEVTAGRPAPIKKFAEAHKVPAPAEKRDMMKASGAVLGDKAETEFLSDRGSAGKGTYREETKSVTLSLIVKYVEIAEQNIGNNIRQLGGKIIKVETSDGNRILFAELNRRKLGELIEKLGLIGEVKERNLASEGLEGNVIIRIKIIGGDQKK